jgi:hypothetical protein
MKALFTAMLVMSLAACGERAQTLGSGGSDATPYSGTGKAYVVDGWKQGDKSSWESQLKARSQYGQNDFSRMN